MPNYAFPCLGAVISESGFADMVILIMLIPVVQSLVLNALIVFKVGSSSWAVAAYPWQTGADVDELLGCTRTAPGPNPGGWHWTCQWLRSPWQHCGHHLQVCESEGRDNGHEVSDRQSSPNRAIDQT